MVIKCEMWMMSSCLRLFMFMAELMCTECYPLLDCYVFMIHTANFFLGNILYLPSKPPA